MTPKLSSLSPEQKTRLLAELDGIDVSQWLEANLNVLFKSKCYLISYDAIIPLRVKVIATEQMKQKWINAAGDILAKRMKPIHITAYEFTTLTQDEECDAVLIVTGKAELWPYNPLNSTSSRRDG